MSIFLAADFLISAGAAAIYAYGLVNFRGSFRSLRPLEGRKLVRRVTVVVPARNEASRVRGLVSSLAASQPSPSEVVLVDDRSEDGTAEAALRESDRLHLRVERVNSVREGWNPKANAVMAGASRVPLWDSVLFLDVDVRGDVGPLIAAASRARPGALIAFEPKFSCETWFCRAAQPFFTGLLHGFYGFNRALDPRDRHSLIYGCCWAIDPYTFWELGGLAPVRSALVEDREFAAYAKSRGVALVPHDARRYVMVESWQGPRDMYELIKRVSYRASRSASRLRFAAFSLGLALLLMWPAAWVPLLAAGAYLPALGPLVSYLLQASLSYAGQRAEGIRGPWFLLSPLPAAVLIAGFVASRWSPVRWRGQLIDPSSLTGT